jgi:predicted transposase YdaD
VRQSAIASAQEALSMGLTLEQAAKIAGLSIDEVEKLTKQTA